MVGEHQVVKVVVANVYAGGATVELEVAASTTIGSLKARLFNSFASRPVPSEQRLIYCGKICQDEASLRDVLRSLESPQTFHLVMCRQQQQPAPAARPAKVPPSHALPAKVLEATGAAYDFHLALAAVYAEALRQGAWTHQARSVLDQAAANARLFETTPPRLGVLAAAGLSPRQPPPPPRPNRVAAAWDRLRANRVFALMDLKLALKLAVVVALLGHDGDLPRLVVLSLLAFLAFSVQTGLARLFAEDLGARLRFLDDDDDRDVDWRQLLRRTLATGRIASRTANLNPFLEATIFLATFAVSLAPAWRPTAIIPAPPDPHQPRRPDD
ncbi:hypothetical protein CTAYLR_001184 [Chrysophaeum taylorii]|uniref:Ubiquitin-like domain-containing protein n=1 Tax=Chrysophaeum taylorii TaxID=2483200 RepID=A0AAD7XNN5_9STRA|nr:hypothetical protein CTAYLR_001184 [Chrysophaeum taylorii]